MKHTLKKLSGLKFIVTVILLLAFCNFSCQENKVENPPEAKQQSSAVEIQFDCTNGRTGELFDDIFDGFGSSDVRFKVTNSNSSESKCDVVIEYITSKGKGGFGGSVKPGKSKVISLMGTPDDPVTEVWIRCGGGGAMTDKCKGTWEAL
jgi:hypothetical protein